MTVIEAERPAPAAPAPSGFAGWWNICLRLALLAALAAAAVVAAPSLRPHDSSPQRLFVDLSSGGVKSLIYDDHTRDLRWSDGWSQWYHIDLSLGDLPKPVIPGRSTAAGDADTEDNSSALDLTWVRDELTATGSRQVVRIVDSSDRLAWIQRLPWDGLSAAAGGAALGAFLLMLFRREHRFGNRWAWFWVMLATSGLGSVLYLALEPSPIWQKPSRQRQLPQRPLFLGGAGLLIAIALKPALAVLALLVSAS